MARLYSDSSTLRDPQNTAHEQTSFQSINDFVYSYGNPMKVSECSTVEPLCGTIRNKNTSLFVSGLRTRLMSVDGDGHPNPLIPLRI